MDVASPPAGAVVLGPHMTDPPLQAENERLRAEIARMHEHILKSEEASRHYWGIVVERGEEIERLRQRIYVLEAIGKRWPVPPELSNG